MHPSDQSKDYLTNWLQRTKQLKQLKGSLSKRSIKFPSSATTNELAIKILINTERNILLIINQLLNEKSIRFQWGRIGSHLEFESFFLPLSTSGESLLRVSNNLSSAIVMQRNEYFYISNLIYNTSRRITKLDNLLKWKITNNSSDLNQTRISLHQSNIFHLFDRFCFIDDKTGACIFNERTIVIIDFESNALSCKHFGYGRIRDIFSWNSYLFLVFKSSIECYQIVAGELELISSFEKEILNFKLLNSFLFVNQSLLLELPFFIEFEFDEQISCISNINDSLVAVQSISSRQVRIYSVEQRPNLLFSCKIDHPVSFICLDKYYLYVISSDTNHLIIYDFVTDKQIRKFKLFVTGLQIKSLITTSFDNLFVIHSGGIDLFVFSTLSRHSKRKSMLNQTIKNEFDDRLEDDDPNVFANLQLKDWLDERDEEERLQVRLERFMHDESISDEETLVEYIKMISMEEL